MRDDRCACRKNRICRPAFDHDVCVRPVALDAERIEDTVPLLQAHPRQVDASSQGAGREVNSVRRRIQVLPDSCCQREPLVAHLDACQHVASTALLLDSRVSSKEVSTGILSDDGQPMDDLVFSPEPCM